MSLIDIQVLNAKKEAVSLKKYQGKVLLIVNTATGCGYTPQYAGLEQLYLKYRDKGFEILDFPCNQFLGQAPGTEAEIIGFCQKNFGVTFETFAKIKVNGPDADPLFTYLKKATAPMSENPCPVCRLAKRVFSSNRIRWNFTKFLVDRSGSIIRRFEPSFTPEQLDPIIQEMI
ncbi:MAG: glutathione peroxidase [Candidatus Izemoplasmatales bacterium]|jgi:glutathione peroxidase|nr:glutathione peroxidase [Candidatus Izemoplasmatales bacterium]MDD4355540.1 glutathione peroxidase [Candidatus Izemoplasmatales bacterium]MDY0373831.1 glutathione peroxidase [Candidatus Izemoplasmatales bacterium]NLF48287.1 glutathione peroxidase [Acholeplasmataceae bacterium]